MRIPEEPGRAAIVRLSALGDVLHALPALEALRALWPRTEIVWIAETVGAALLGGHPALAGVVEIPRRRWQGDLGRVGRLPGILAEVAEKRGELRRIGADVAIDLQGNLRSGIVTTATGSPVRIGFARRDSREGNALFLNARIPPLGGRPHRPERDLAIPRALGWRGSRPRVRIPIRPAHRRWAEEALASRGLADGSWAALLPGVSAFGRFKAWTAEGYVRLAERILERLPVKVALVGGPPDGDAVEGIRGLVRPPLPEAFHAPDPLSLAALLERAAVVVGADTGPLHLAAYLDRPVVALFGPTNPRVYGPVGARTRVLRSGVACSPCSLRRCDHAICMRLIDAETVIGAVEEVLGAGDGARRRKGTGR